MTTAPHEASWRVRSSVRTLAAVAICFWGFGSSPGKCDENKVVRVTDDASLRQALRDAGPGTQIQIAPGRYRGGVSATDLRGTKDRPITIEGSDKQRPPLFEGGNEAWHLTDCAHVTLRNIAVKGQKHNGINVDDGGTYDTPSHHIVLEKIQVSDTGPKGNFDGIKLSGVDDFTLQGCEITGWGGQAIDMVGCHRGLIEGCTLRGKKGFSQTTGTQTKGGSSDIVIRGCKFFDAGARAANIGGSTGLKFFRPLGTKYEARNITVEGCTFVGSEAPIAFVGVDGATVRYNTVHHPGKWIFRILQETTADGFVPCRNGRFERNLVVFRNSDVRVFTNIGPNTLPKSFTFCDNFWYCEDKPSASKPTLPANETGGVYAIDPKQKSPSKNDFTPQSKTATEYGATAWKQDPPGK